MRLRKRPAAANAVTTISTADGLAPYAEFLSARQAAGAAEKALVSALLQEHQVQCSRKTMATWLATRSGETWCDYVSSRFTLASSRPIPVGSPRPLVTAPLLQWISYCSWRFCPDCGRMRTDGRLTSLSGPKMNDVSIRCDHKINDRGRCGRRPTAFNYPRKDHPKPSEPAIPFTTEECYVCPLLSDWPVYDTATGEFVEALLG